MFGTQFSSSFDFSIMAIFLFSFVALVSYYFAFISVGDYND